MMDAIRFSSMICAHGPALRKYAQSLTFSPVDADDLMQDTWERALRKQHLFAEDTNLRAWLFTVMRNLFMDRKRTATRVERHRRERVAMGSHRLAPRQADSVMLSEIATFLRAMNPKMSSALLDHLNGVSYESRAYRRGIAVGTAKSRLSRARGELAALVDPPEAPPLQIELAMLRRKRILEGAA